MLPAVLIAFFASQSILSRHHANIAFSDPHVARAVIGAALYLTVIALFSLGLGAIIRNTAGGIAAFAAVLFVIPPLMNVLPASWNDAASRYLPSNAGRAILSITHDSGSLSPWVGFAVFCGYAAVTARCRGAPARAARHLAGRSSARRRRLSEQASATVS